MRPEYRPIRTVAPAATPVTVAEAKAHCRVTTSADDTLIGSLIDAAVSKLDGWSGILGRCLVTQTWTQTFDDFGDEMYLPFPSCTVTSVVYLNAAGASTTLSTSIYGVRDGLGGCYIDLKHNQTWPTVYDEDEVVTVTFTAGYGDASAVPAAIKQAILLMVGGLYSNVKADPMLRREMVEGIGTKEWDSTGAMDAVINRTVDALLSPYRLAGT